MAITAAQLVVKVNADSKNFETGMAKVATALGPAGPLMLGIAGVAAAGLVIGGVAAKMAGDFQAGMITLVTGAGEAQSNLKLVSDGILQMAVDTGTSTKQLTDGMFMIESAGFHGAAGLAVLKAAAEGAKVGAADLGTVADGVTTIMVDYAKKNVSAAQATNTLIAAVAQGKTHMQDLASSIATVLPAASATRVSLTDVMGAMAQMTSEGVPAANASTFLRQTLLALVAPAGKAAKTLKDIGLTTEEVSNAMQVSLPGALQMIEEHLAKKFPASQAIYNAEMAKAARGAESVDQALQNVASQGGAQYVAALKDLVGGSREIQGMFDLSGDHLQGFKDKVLAISAAVKAGGNQITGWTLVQTEFNYKMSVLGEVVQTLMIRLGTQLLPVLTKAATAMATGITWAVSHATTVLQVAGPIILGVAAAILSYLVPSLIAAGVAAIPLVAAMLVAAAPFIAIGAAVALLSAGIIYAYQHFKPFREAVNEAVATVRVFWTELEVRLKPVIAELFAAIKIGLAWLAPIWKAVWPDMFLVLKGVWDTIVGMVQIAWSLVSGIIKVGLDILSGNWSQAWTDIKDMLGGVWAGIRTMLRGEMEALTGALKGYWDGLAAMFKQMGITVISNLITGIEHMAGQLASALGSVVGNAIKNIPGLNNLHIPGFATGGTMPSTGLAVVGEQGPELVKLPGGAQITPMNGNGAGVSGLPAGMSPAYGAISGHANGQPVQVNLYLDSRMLAQAVVKQVPTVVRNATGARSF